MNGSSDAIQLILPCKAEYVSVARLAVSGIASRMGFDIDTVEDIKVAVSEVCNKLILLPRTQVYRILFEVEDKLLKITFQCDQPVGDLFSGEEKELGISIINALMDEVELYAARGNLLSMTKAVERNTEYDRS